MAEPDHIFIRPLPNLAGTGYPAAFPFFYIKPDQNEKIVRKFYPKEKGPLKNIDPIGNSPVIIKKVRILLYLKYMRILGNSAIGFLVKYVPLVNIQILFLQDLLKKIAPTWMNVSLRMKEDRETDKAFGWVLEM